MSAPQRLEGVPDSPWFRYEGGRLVCDEVPLEAIAAEVGTPTYVYSARAIDAAYDRIDAALAFTRHTIAYAVKANGNLAILRRLAAKGCGADIVSGGELARVLRAGFPGERVVFSGVGKREDELRAALQAGVRAIHVESVPELDAIERVATALDVRAPVALRVNPDVDPQTHPYIATGLHTTKFGLEMDAAEALLPRLLSSPHVRLDGVACHIGSQLGAPAPLEEAVTLLARFAVRCHAAGATLRSIDVGGGWPMAYGNEAAPYPPESAFGAAIERGLRAGGALDLDLEVVTEPGRALVGDAGVLLTRVLYNKDRGDRRFVIVDAGMSDLIRPSLYGAYHAIVPVRAPSASEAPRRVDVVGPICESGDFFAKDRALPEVEPGALLAIRGAGAYGREMASTYNARPPAAEVLVVDDRHRVVRRRAPVESLWAEELL
ncbi:MAG: diaminopimelate decarboxylase [Myxococcales bacterium]|nr:diaminopimelate decarboxylase [Myxococcales bacterium]